MGKAMRWRRSSFCADAACVEVASKGNYVWVRDSKNLDQRPYRFTKQDWNVFVEQLASADSSLS